MARYFFLFSLILLSSNFSFAREVSYAVQDLKVELRNTNTELNILKEQYRTLEEILYSIQKEFQQLKNQQRQQLHYSQNNEHLSSLNQKAETNFSNVQKLSQYANQTSSALSEYQKRIAELEQTVATQKNNFTHMENAVKSLIKIVQEQNTTQGNRTSFSDIAENAHTYKVQAGDSLDKISRKYNVSISELKKVNLLKNDLIIIGQELRIP